jgi:RNA polymerase sigma-70 factor (ECF subfamily)
LLKETDKKLVRRALRKLPTEFLEVIVLREFEELSYKQIAETIQVPVGTVMSRLARARGRLAQIIREPDVMRSLSLCDLCVSGV